MRTRSFWIAVFLAFLLGADPPAVGAATNRALGGVNGINNGTISGGDGTGTSAFTINSTPLALVKQARDTSGNLLANGSSVPSGTDIYFVIYVDNPTDATATDVILLDQINESQFTYIDGSLATTNVPSGSSDATIWAGSWTLVSQDPGGDIGSIIDTAPTDGNRDRLTVGNEPSQPNGQLDIPTGTLQAIRFRVRIN